MLIDIQVRSDKSAERSRKLFDSRGLYLQVMPNGGRYWRFDYSFEGKRKTLAFGTYPDVPLAKARAAHQEARAKLAQGVDPIAERQKQEVVRFEPAARAW